MDDAGIFPSDVETLERDAGQFLGFVRMMAKRTAVAEDYNLYDPGLGIRVGVDK
jgi:hypothetical protein